MKNTLKSRKHVRLKKFDYSRAGTYFVTLCAYEKKCSFGRVVEGEMVLGSLGSIIEKCWADIPTHFSSVGLDRSVVMPNHFHGVLWLTDGCRGEACLAPTEAQTQKPKLGTVIASFKSAVSKAVREQDGTLSGPVWQRSYYEHIVRGEADLNKIREYITNNPLQWALDEENPENITGEACLAPTDLGEKPK